MYDSDEKICIEEVFVTFLSNDSEIVGQLIWRARRFVFEGNMDESARIFFDGCLRQVVDDYIEDNG